MAPKYAINMQRKFDYHYIKMSLKESKQNEIL